MPERDRNPHVLLIEDDPNMVLMVENRLKASGFASTAAMTGEEGLALARNGAFTVALLDLRLPDMDGFEVMAALRTERPELPVVMMTAHGTDETGEKARSQGARGFLLKPFSRQLLIETLSSVLGTEETL
jgi:two-component system response regulator GlrR